jgi:CRISPR-associated endonuclease/helicase Cas3
LLRDALLAKPELREVAAALESLVTSVSGPPLAISTLRGQFADNAEWRDDPSRPAVVIGTVDMIGSRLLFSGYGCGFKSRPLHAAFLGQDALLVHDEAHLEPAFQKLVSAIESEQRRCGEWGKFSVIELTATSRSADDGGDPLFTDADRADPRVLERFDSRKGINFNPVEDAKKISDRITRIAMSHKNSGQAILVFLRKLDDVEKVASSLRSVKLCVETLTGTLRGRERDELAKENTVFARFMPDPQTTPKEGTVYLICTSAGEVGVNISADHLVCDLAPFDSMTQRFGRVNRFGKGDACIDVVHRQFEDEPRIGTPSADQKTEATSGDREEPLQDEKSGKKNKATPYEQACELTLSLMYKLPRRPDERHDASPSALAMLPPTDRQAAFTPTPAIPTVSDILFDAWAMTSIREQLPGRPPIADWLHGIAEWEPPETHVAWREEVGLLTKDQVETYVPEDLLEDYPLKPHELLRDRTTRVFAHLEKIAARHPDSSAWVIHPEGRVSIVALDKLVKKDRQNKPAMKLDECTVLLPPVVGGLKAGLLDGDANFDETGSTPYDIADLWLNDKGQACRSRLWDDQQIPDGMRLIRSVDTGAADEYDTNEDETPKRRYWHWYVRPRSADDDGSRTARSKQELLPHLHTAESFARSLVAKLGMKGPEATAVIWAARWHDLGKDRLIWQWSIGNREYPTLILAKSGPGMRPVDITRYRHEFGSLIDVYRLAEFQNLAPEVQELVMHLIAAHHGRARPYFPVEEVFDLNATEMVAEEFAKEIPRRFARLQRRYGRWGLAYLESLVRAADAMASQAGIRSMEDNVTHNDGGYR